MNGNTALHSAVLENDKELIILLIENGANLKIKNKDHKTVSELAIQKRQTELINLLAHYDA